MKRLNPSWLHRKRGWQLGHAPPGWYASDCPGDPSIPMSIGVTFFCVGLLAAFSLFHPPLGWFRWITGSLSIALIGASLAFLSRVYQLFQDRERHARARIRRQECVTCGVKLSADDAEFCLECRQ